MIALKSLLVMESPGTFEIRLDTRGEGLREAMNKGGYDLVDELVETCFNQSGFIKPKKGVVDIELLGFRYDLRTADVEKKIRSLGYRPAKVLEFARFGAWYPQIQFVYQILCWSGFDRFDHGLHHALFTDSSTVNGQRMRILGAHDILKGVPALARIACVKLD